MLRLRTFALALLTAVVIFSTYRLHRTEHTLGAMKRDLKELDHISYGLFNVDEWKKILSQIVTEQICSLEITPANRDQLKAHFEGLMYKMIDRLEGMLREKRDNKGLNTLMRKIVLDIFVDVDQIKQSVPGYADLVLDYLNDPQNREELQGLVLQQFDALTDKTMGKVDYGPIEAICARYGTLSREGCAEHLRIHIDELQQEGSVWLALLLSACAALTLFVVFNVNAGPSSLLWMLACAVALLAAGVSMPMIDIEAAIHTFGFTLMGEEVKFHDQVLFYQSKSILQVVQVLVEEGEPGLVTVGVLILVFSVLFPVSKLTATLVAVLRKRTPTGRIGRFLVFKSGKWSMADVLVVALFMAYIGFSGVVDSQLAQMSEAAVGIELLTTNDSTLRIGFFIFLAYCLMGLLLAVRMERLQGSERAGAK